MNDLLEREWWLMHQLRLGYNDIQSMPWEEFDWFYHRHTQYLIDLEKKQNEEHGIFG